MNNTNNIWFDSDFDSYLLYMDDYICKQLNKEQDESKPISFEEFRQLMVS